MARIGVLTSGGDSPGMNAAVRAIVRFGIDRGMEVYGISRGYEGLIDGEIEKMERRSVGDILQRGGTILKTARSKRFMTEEGQERAVRNLETFRIDALVVIGGNGSYAGALELSKRGVPVICLPGTIDNDLGYTDYTIGFDTAVNTVLDAITRIRDTSSAHERTTVIEVMGRHCGWLAMQAGIAGGAEAILIPEVEYNLDDVCDGLIKSYNAGRRYSLVVVAEGVGSGIEIGNYIAEKTNMETRVSVLGHIQRGGAPSVRDRLKASQLGERAALALINGQSDVVFGFYQGRVAAIDLTDAVTKKKEFDQEYIKLSKLLL